ncbi:hypothetical protein Csa_012495 [Cucumis sativus]|uniref:Uncharacterized protein n=1 Tax=Cucumis sativus TaxID=3659 RepID=A0A0A0L2E0_CUCSA|nr:hypothetical protein Csa_012495 [Cucumis sativus]
MIVVRNLTEKGAKFKVFFFTLDGEYNEPFDSPAVSTWQQSTAEEETKLERRTVGILIQIRHRLKLGKPRKGSWCNRGEFLSLIMLGLGTLIEAYQDQMHNT